MVSEFSVLGDVSIRVDGRPVDAGPARQRSVLAVLLVNANQAISTDQLIDWVWDGIPPRRARGALASHISRIRMLLGDDASIVPRASSYALLAEPGSIDLHEFRRLVAGAEKHEPVLERALALWRGDPFAGLDCRWLEDRRRTLREERFAAQLDLVDARLGNGGHTDVLPEVIARAGEHPLDERVAGQLMLALFRSGRQAEALQRYQKIRTRLADELGTDPGPALRRLHHDILTGGREEPATILRPVPRQLPAAPRGFAGRVDELAHLTAAVDNETGRTPTVVVSALAGAGGIGKTSLALRWAYQHLDRFPDGQLFVNLRGFDPSGEPMSAAVAVRGFLDALGVHPNAVPADSDAQSALYRSLTADKRMLILLDNAVDTEQVIPLLPGGRTSTVLVTSRNRLIGLVSAHGAQPLWLDVLPDADARSLLAARLGAERLTGEPNAIDDLLAHCAGLPLALSIVASRAQAQRELPLATIAAELQDTTSRLSGLDDHDSAASVRSVLSWSTAALPADQHRMFKLLSVVPGPDIGIAAAASLMDTTADKAAVLLRALERVSLVQQHSAGRYRMHDLVRLHAAEQDLSKAEQQAALLRLVDFYNYAVHRAERLAFPFRDTGPLHAVEAGRHPHTPSDKAGAWAWYIRERPCLLAVEQAASQHGLHLQVCQLAWHLVTFRTRHGFVHENVAAWHNALAAAVQLGDACTLSATYRMLGRAYGVTDMPEKGLDYLQQAWPFAEQTGIVAERAELEQAFAVVLAYQGKFNRSLEHAKRSYELIKSFGSPLQEVSELSMICSVSALLGDHAQARAGLEKTIVVYRQHGNVDGEAFALSWLAYIARQEGQLERALELYQHACATYRKGDDAFHTANTLVTLGEVHLELGHEVSARDTWLQAMQLFDAQHRTADAEQLQQRLDSAQ
jgi:DNA-binding SARP family transcriptional activator/tetratricopeptide (TPR) repeat protein